MILLEKKENQNNVRYAATPLRGERDKRRHKALQTLQQMKRILNKEKDGVCLCVCT